MIKINDIFDNCVAFLFDPNDNYVGTINSNIQLDDVRIQIKREKVSGYYLKFPKDFDDGEKHYETVEISDEGLFDHYPKDFFNLNDMQLEDLLGLTQNDYSRFYR